QRRHQRRFGTQLVLSDEAWVALTSAEGVEDVQRHAKLRFVLDEGQHLREEHAGDGRGAASRREAGEVGTRFAVGSQARPPRVLTPGPSPRKERGEGSVRLRSRTGAWEASATLWSVTLSF